jgi:hypothetical protein
MSPAKLPRRCSIAGCNRPHHAKGLCPPHYQQDLYYRSQRATQAAVRNRARAERVAQRPELTAVCVVCPDDLIPLITQIVDNDAAQLFRVAWRWCGEQALARQRGAA